MFIDSRRSGDVAHVRPNIYTPPRKKAELYADPELNAVPRQRHPDDSGVIRAQRLEHDDDLHARAEQRRSRSAHPADMAIGLMRTGLCGKESYGSRIWFYPSMPSGRFRHDNLALRIKPYSSGGGA